MLRRLLSRDFFFPAIMLGILSILTIMLAIAQSDDNEDYPPLVSFSRQRDGAMALRLWLENMGFEVQNETQSEFSIPAETGTMLMLAPNTLVTAEEWQAIDQFVSAGGTLILIGDSFRAADAFEHYQFNLNNVGRSTAITIPQNPLWVSPPIDQGVQINADTYLSSPRSDYIVHLAIADGPVMVSFVKDQGRVVLGTVPFLFTNQGIQQNDNAEAIFNIIAASVEPGTVWFDEWHHSLNLEQAERLGFGNWLRYSPTGRAFVFVTLVSLLGLALSGRRFGRAVPPPQTLTKRSPLEYVSAMAHLSRRAGHRQATAEEYYYTLKRRLAARYRIDPNQSDDAYLNDIKHYDETIDIDALRALFNNLKRKNLTETELLKYARETIEW